MVLLAGLVAGCGSEPIDDPIENEEAAVAEEAQGLTTYAPTTITSGLQPRTYQLHVPSSYTGAPMPLVFVLHGLGGGLAFAVSSGMTTKAESAGFMVVSLLATRCDPSLGDPNCVAGPNGYPRAWNTGTNPSLGIVADDVQYVRDVLQHVVDAGYNVDSTRVYAAGLSSGGGMTYRLAAEMPDVLAAVGVVSGSIGIQYLCNTAVCDLGLGYSCGWDPGTHACTTYKVGVSTPPPQGPIPVVIIHGSADDHLWWNGAVGVAPPGLDALPLAAATNTWATVNGCAGAPTQTNFGSYVKTRWAPCDLGTEVVSYFVEAMRHEWPPGATTSFSANNALWAFFLQHQL